MIAFVVILVILLMVVAALVIAAGVGSREPLPALRTPRSAWVDVVTDRQVAKQGDMVAHKKQWFDDVRGDAFEFDPFIDVQPIQRDFK